LIDIDGTKIYFHHRSQREDGMQDFWKQIFIADLPKLFGEHIFQNIDNFVEYTFLNLTYAVIFVVVKSEGLLLCNELKIQAKHGSEKAHQDKIEMDTFCEAFGFTKIEAPSTKAKKKSSQKG